MIIRFSKLKVGREFIPCSSLFLGVLCVVIVIRAVEYFMFGAALKWCRFATLCVTREVWGNSAKAAWNKSSPRLFSLKYEAIDIALELSSSACAWTVTKPHGDFDSVKKRTGFTLTSQLTQRAEPVRPTNGGRGSRGERGEECHACVGKWFLAVLEINDLNMCYSWESAESKVKAKALAVQPHGGRGSSNHKELRDRSCGGKETFEKEKNIFFSYKESTLMLQKSGASLPDVKRSRRPCEDIWTLARSTYFTKKRLVLPALWSSGRDVPISVWQLNRKLWHMVMTSCDTATLMECIFHADGWFMNMWPWVHDAWLSSNKWASSG